jgi:hypothetical protein
MQPFKPPPGGGEPATRWPLPAPEPGGVIAPDPVGGLPPPGARTLLDPTHLPPIATGSLTDTSETAYGPDPFGGSGCHGGVNPRPVETPTLWVEPFRGSEEAQA